ncbi:MAG: hypothetical protein GY751_23155, partial [Bacteroidetes bacterium]|nr:hypothetical protein [Bacteroidota bacterium]
LPELVGGGSDTIVLHKGMVAHYSDYLADANLGSMMHLSTSTILSPGSNQKVITGYVHDAVIMGCDRVSVHINLGVDSEPEILISGHSKNLSSSHFGCRPGEG